MIDSMFKTVLCFCNYFPTHHSAYCLLLLGVYVVWWYEGGTREQGFPIQISLNPLVIIGDYENVTNGENDYPAEHV